METGRQDDYLARYHVGSIAIHFLYRQVYAALRPVHFRNGASREQRDARCLSDGILVDLLVQG